MPLVLSSLIGSMGVSGCGGGGGGVDSNSDFPLVFDVFFILLCLENIGACLYSCASERELGYLEHLEYLQCDVWRGHADTNPTLQQSSSSQWGRQLCR